MSRTKNDLETGKISESTIYDQHLSSGPQAKVEDESSGAFYQSKVNQRKGFLENLLLPLDKEYMDAVHRDAERVAYEDGGEEEKRIKRKIDKRILPFLLLSFMCESTFDDCMVSTDFFQTTIVNFFGR